MYTTFYSNLKELHSVSTLIHREVSSIELPFNFEFYSWVCMPNMMSLFLLTDRTTDKLMDRGTDGHANNIPPPPSSKWKKTRSRPFYNWNANKKLFFFHARLVVLQALANNVDRMNRTTFFVSPAKHSDTLGSLCPSSVRPSVCLSVRLSHFSVTLSKAMFRRRHMHSSECCHYFLLCRMWSIATHRDHFVRRPSVCLSARPSVTLFCHTSTFQSYVSQATHAFLGMLPLFFVLTTYYRKHQNITFQSNPNR